MEKPFFSVIITTYNRPDKLIRAIQSVICQNFDDFELIIVNDGSSVDYSNVEKYIENNNTINYYFKDNEERSVARNFGVEKSKGKFVCFLDDDDYFLSSHLNILYQRIISENITSGIYHTLPIIKTKSKEEKLSMPSKKEIQSNIDFYYNKGFIALNCVCFSQDAIKKYKFDPSLFLIEDKHQQLRTMCEFPVFFINKHTSVYDRTGDNTWNNGIVKNSLEELRVFKLIYSIPEIKNNITKKTKKDKFDKLYYLLIVQFYREMNFLYLTGLFFEYLANKTNLFNLKISSKYLAKKILNK